MRTILTFYIILTTAIAVFPQYRYDDAVYLKNGAIVRGRIVEVIPQKQLTLETADRIVLVYQLGEVAKYYKRTYPAEEPQKATVARPGITIKKLALEPAKAEKKRATFNHPGLKKGAHINTEAGYAIATGKYDLDFIKADFIAGYRFNQFFSAGIGAGCRCYLHSVAVEKQAVKPSFALSWPEIPADRVKQHLSIGFPLFADFRANLINNNVTPYASLDIGYSFIITDATPGDQWNYQPSNPDAVKRHLYKGGFFITPACGLSFKISRKHLMNINIGCEMQRMTVLIMEIYNYWGGSAAGWQTSYFKKSSVELSNCISLNSSITF
jgi:hypothetical protein